MTSYLAKPLLNWHAFVGSVGNWFMTPTFGKPTRWCSARRLVSGRSDRIQLLMARRT